MQSIIETMFDYDKEYLSSLNKLEKTSFIRKYINDVASAMNDTTLIIKDMSPNANLIYHIYSDGTITRQKGGWAYGQRTVFDVEYAFVKPNTFFTFPNKGENTGDTYVIATIENCHKLKKLMNELLLCI